MLRVIVKVYLKNPFESSNSTLLELCSIRKLSFIEHTHGSNHSIVTIDKNLFKKWFNEDPVVGKEYSLRGSESFIDRIEVMGIVK